MRCATERSSQGPRRCECYLYSTSAAVPSTAAQQAAVVWHRAGTHCLFVALHAEPSGKKSVHYCISIVCMHVRTTDYSMYMFSVQQYTFDRVAHRLLLSCTALCSVGRTQQTIAVERFAYNKRFAYNNRLLLYCCTSISMFR